MSTIESDLKNWSDESLLQRRALGPELDQIVHARIEAELLDRGINPPPIPKSSVLVPGAAVNDTNGRKNLRVGLVIFVGLIGAGFATSLSRTWIGPAILVSFIGVALFLKFQNRCARLAPTESEAEFEKSARRLGLNELMQCAAKGDASRLAELIAYKQPLDDTDVDGATALMYAARNGHTDCVKILLEAGASTDVATDKSSTALSIAEKFGHAHVATLIRDCQRRGEFYRENPRS